MPSYRGMGEFSCAGIGGVAVLPEARIGGAGRAMMEWSLAHMRESGFAAAALYAFREDYYRRYGYEFCGYRLQIKCPQARFPKLETDLPVRRLSPDDVILLDPVYDAFARKLSGSVRRNQARWKNRMGSKPPMIYAVGDPIEAYCWTSMEGFFWEELKFGEVAWNSRRGYEGLLAVMGGLGINRSDLTWNEPSRSPFLMRFKHQGVQTTIDRPVMWRILNVEAALQGLKPDDSGEFTFSVRDEYLAENQGPWTVRYRPEGVEVEQGGDPDFSLDIRQFAQAYLGEPGLKWLAEEGLVDVRRERGLQEATRLLTPMPTVCTEFF